VDEIRKRHEHDDFVRIHGHRDASGDFDWDGWADDLHCDRATLLARLTALEAECETLKTENAKLDHKLAEYEWKLHEATDSLAVVRAECTALEADNAALKAEVAEARAKATVVIPRAAISIAKMVDEYTRQCWNEKGLADFAFVVERRLRRFLPTSEKRK
jgi:peptidoglycan hydrolase CwlO-like protein